jgi:hypothetical protein
VNFSAQTLGSGICAADIPVTATGANPSLFDRLNANLTPASKAITGFVPGTVGGGLKIYLTVTTNTAHFLFCNETANSITTTGTATLIWGITR